MKLFSPILILTMFFSGNALATEKSHLEAAQKLIAIYNLEKMWEGMRPQFILAATEKEIKRNPCLVPYKKEFQSALEEVTREVFKEEDYKELRDFTAKIYAEYFSEQELNDILAFNQTSTGKKLLALTPELTAKAAIMGNKIGARITNRLEEPAMQAKIEKVIQEKLKHMDASTFSPECKKFLNKE